MPTSIYIHTFDYVTETCKYDGHSEKIKSLGNQKNTRGFILNIVLPFTFITKDLK